MKARLFFQAAALFACFAVIPLFAQDLIRRPQLIVTDTSDNQTILQPTMGANDGTDDGSAAKGKDADVYTGSGSPQGAGIACTVLTSDCNGIIGYGFVQFSLAAMPTANIKSAQIQIYTGILHWGCGWPWAEDPNFGLRNVTSDWNEMTIDWNSQPSVDPTPISSYTYAGIAGVSDLKAYGWVSFDVTDLYKGWADGSIPNHGVRISHDNGSCMNCSTAYFYSSDDGITSITYSGSSGGSPNTVSAKLIDASSNEGVVGRPLTFTVGALSCIGSTDSTGLASCPLEAGSGNPNIAIVFEGDTRYYPSSLTTHITDPGNASLAYAGPYSVQNGKSAVLSALLVNYGTPLVGETVTLTLGEGATAQSCTATTDGTGLASCSVGPIAQTAGSTPVTAAFAGDGTYSPDSITVSVTTQAGFGITLSNAGNLSVTPGSATGNTSLISVTPTLGFTGTVNLTCEITSSPASAVSPATCSIPASVDITGATAATATLTVTTTSTTTLGDYAVTVTGTDAATGAITATTIVTATVHATPSFALSKSGDIAMSKGASTGNTAVITVTPSGGFTGTVNLTCAITTSIVNPKDSPTCSIAPSVSITGATAATATLTVNSTAKASNSSDRPMQKLFVLGGGPVLAIVFLFGIPTKRRKLRTTLGMLVMLAALAGGMIACGSKGDSGTTKGSYSITVTATSGSITQTNTVALTIQ